MDATLRYTVETRTKEEITGKFLDRDVYVRVYDDVDRFNNVMKNSLSITHPNLLRSFFGHATSKYKYLIYQSFSTPLETYLDELSHEVNFSSRRVPLFSQMQLYVHPKIQTLLRSILQFLKFTHGQKMSLGGFTAKNIVMVEGIPNFFDIIPMEMNRKNEYRMKNADFNSVVTLINQIYVGAHHDKSPGLTHLMTYLQKWRGNEELIYNHSSLWDGKQRLHLIKDMDDHEKALSPDDAKLRSIAVKAIQLTIPVEWKKLITEGTQLNREPLLKILNYKKTEHYDPYINTIPSLLEFVRNAATHLSEHSDRGLLFDERDLDAILSTLFPLLVEEVQHGFITSGFTRFL